MIVWLKNSLRGVCMGVADLIPGVSGGTLALILGIYAQFVAALSAMGPAMLKALLKKEFWGHLKGGLSDPERVGEDDLAVMAHHVLFLGSLALGIGVAVLVGVRFIPDLLEHYPEQMNGLFFGLVLASLIIPYRKMKAPTRVHVLPLLLMLAGTFWLVGFDEDATDRAAGTVELRFEAPLASELVLDSLRHGGTRFLTNDHPAGKEKREIAFVPSQRQVIPKGTRVARVAVRARMRGTKSNLAADRITCAAPKECEAHLQGLPEGTRLTQAKELGGGADPSLLLVFLAGVIAISAMVLPGISGSFILLLLGLYTYVTYSLREAIYAQDPASLTVVAVFMLAMLVGLLLFARVLKWLLTHHHDMTMAALVGLMAGSLRKLWPFVESVEGGGTALVLPETLENPQILTLGLLGVGIVIVMVLERLGRGRIQAG